MALIKCSECGKNISENALTCPNCGNPINDKSGNKICRDCGKESKPGATTCSACGAPLDDSYSTNTRTNAMATVGFVLGVISLFLNLFAIPGVLAIIFSCIGSVQIKNNGEKGHGYAIFGFIFGFISVGYTIYKLAELQDILNSLSILF